MVVLYHVNGKGPILTNRLIFGKGFFQLVLSEYTNQSHKFKNLNFCDATLLYSLWSTTEPEEVKPLEDTQATKEQAQVASDSQNSTVTQSNATTSAEQTSATQASSAQTQSASTAQTADQTSANTQSSSATQTAAYASGMFCCNFKFNIVVYQNIYIRANAAQVDYIRKFHTNFYLESTGTKG